jgi:hypothetical protein
MNEVIALGIMLIGPDSVGGRTHNEQQGFEKDNYVSTLRILELTKSTGATSHPTS